MATNPRTGLGLAFGFKKETTWGTPVTVDKFVPILGESLGGGPEILKSEAIINNRLFRDTNQAGTGNEKYGGSVQMELYDHAGFIALLEGCLGTLVTTGAGPYTHTFTPGEPLPSYTMQVAVPDTAGTARTKTYTSAMIDGYEMAFEKGKIATAAIDVTAKSEATNTAAATVSYPSNLIPVKCTNVALSIYGGSVNVESVKLKGANNLNSDRYYLGSSTLGAKQVSKDLRTLGGDIQLELEDNFTQYARYKAGTQGALSLVCTVGSNTITVTANIMLTGETPKVGNRDLVMQPLAFEVLGSTDAAAITIVAVNSDSTP